MAAGARRHERRGERFRGKPAHDRPDHVRKPRPCLKCTEDFDSAWAGERICPNCRPQWTYRDADPAEPYSVGRRAR